MLLFISELFQPLSFILADNSGTLSRGVIAFILQIFLKSLTACEQLAALPPTPTKNILVGVEKNNYISYRSEILCSFDFWHFQGDLSTPRCRGATI